MTPPSPPAERTCDLLAPGRPMDWALAGQLLAWCRHWEGEDAVLAAARPHRAALGCVFPHLPLGGRDRIARDRLAPSPTGYLPHNWSVALPIRRGVEAFFRALLRTPARVRVYAAGRAGREDAALLVALSRPGEGGPAVDLALDLSGAPRSRAPGGTDAHATTRSLWNGASMRDEGRPSLLPPARPRAPRIDPWRGEDDLALHRRLRRGAPLDPTALDAAMEVVEAAFRGLRFLDACALARELLPAVDPGDRRRLARLHTLAAVAAYSLKVRSDDDGAFADAVGAHLDAALVNEDDPTRRTHLLYRLGIHLGRRRSELDAALARFDEAVAEAVTPHDVAWARNGRAYVHMRRGALPAAIADTVAALAVVGVRPYGSTGRSRRSNEAPGSRVGLLSNLGRLYELGGEVALALRIEVRVARLERALRGAPLLSTPRLAWLSLRRGDWRGALGYAATAVVLEQAADRPVEALDGLLLLADVHARLGEAAEAVEAARGARELRARSGEDALAEAAVEAEIAVRGGLAAEEALALLEEEGSALAPALRALRAALQGDDALADTEGDVALERAIPKGAQALVPVLVILADALTTMGRRSSARDAWREVLRLADPSAIGERFRAEVALAHTPEALAACLARAPEGLAEPGGWRALGVLLRRVRAVGVARVVTTPEASAGWAIARRAERSRR